MSATLDLARELIRRPSVTCATVPDRGRAEWAQSLASSQFHSRSLALLADSLRRPG